MKVLLGSKDPQILFDCSKNEEVAVDRPVSVLKRWREKDTA
jgi:predicted nuclease with RNAse H fold